MLGGSALAGACAWALTGALSIILLTTGCDKSYTAFKDIVKFWSFVELNQILVQYFKFKTRGFKHPVVPLYHG